jgi:O-antigen/teichoic acid export membrane protein
LKLLLKNILNKILKSETSIDVIKYTIFSFLGKSIPFLILPYLTKILSPEDFGFLAEFNYYNLAMMILVGLGSNSVTIQLYYEAPENYRKSLLVASNLVTILNGMFLILILIILKMLFKINIEIILFSIFISVFMMCNNLFNTFLQIEKKIITLGISQLLSSILSIAIAIFLIKIFHINWEARVYGIIVSTILIYLYYIYRYRRGEIYINEILLYIKKFYFLGVKLLPSLVVGWFFINSDKYILSLNDSKINLGKYSLSVSISQLSELIFNSFGLALIPNIFLTFNNTSDNFLLKKYINKILFIFIGLSILLTLTLPIFYNFYIRSNFRVSNFVVVILIQGYLFIAMNSIYTSALLSKKYNFLISKISLLALLISIIPAVFLIKYFLIFGAALTFLLINFIQFILLNYYFKKIINESK